MDDFNRPHKSLNYLTPIKYGQQHYPCSASQQQLYPQTANGNLLQVEESRLVDKVLKKPNHQNLNPLVLN